MYLETLALWFGGDRTRTPTMDTMHHNLAQYNIPVDTDKHVMRAAGRDFSAHDYGAIMESLCHWPEVRRAQWQTQASM